jgi:hypothetical protein
MATEQNTQMRLEVDCSTGEHKLIPLTDEEIAFSQAEAIKYDAWEAEKKAEEARIKALKESAKAKLVAGEPLTEEEAATIVL